MEPSDEVREIILDWFKAAVSGDASWRDRHVSREASLRIAGTDPGEWLSGDTAYAFLKNEAEHLTPDLNVKIDVAEAEAFVENEIAWGFALPTITLPNGSTAKVRWSAVFHREDGGWKLVQLHASAGVPNDQLFAGVFA